MSEKQKDGYYTKWKVDDGKILQVTLDGGNDIYEKVSKKKARTMNVADKKECTLCHKVKPLSKFYTRYGKPTPGCKKCRSKKTHDTYIRKKQEKTTGEKVCSTCHKLKPVTEFYINKKMGKSKSDCKGCCKKASTAYTKQRRLNEKSAGGSTESVGQAMDEASAAEIKAEGLVQEMTILEEQNEKPEIGIVDATKEDALPLTDSSSVIEEQAEAKKDTKDGWHLFRHKKGKQ